MLWWILGTLNGCSQADRVSECNQLIGVVNPTIQALAAHAQYDGSDYTQGQKQMTQMKERASDGAAAAHRLSEAIRNETIQRHAAEYAILCDQIAQTAQGLAEDMIEAESIARDAAEMETILQSAIDSIMETCRQPDNVTACGPVMKALVELPDDFSRTEEIVQQLELIRDTRGDREDVNRAIAGVVDTLELSTQLYARIRAIEDSVQVHQQHFREASERQDHIVSALNQSCQ